jgi:aminopeptidase N
MIRSWDRLSRAAARSSVVALLALSMLLPAVASPVLGRTSYDMEASYDVSVHLDWDSRRVHVKTTIELLNTSGGAVHHIILNTVAAKLGSIKNLKAKVDGASIEPNVSGQTIKLTLEAPLAQDASTTVWVAYRAKLLNRNSGRNYLWSKLGGVAHLYRFIPWISRRIPFGSQAHGEPFLTPVSPSVRVTASSDRKLVWATSGRRIGKDGKTFTFMATDVRDFNMIASPSYKTVSGKSLDGETKIVAYTRAANGRRLIRLARQELDRYERRTGVQYPHPTYRIAESGAGLAMESPGLIWIPGSRSAADHPFLVSHETAHQWFYAVVGNDQSTDAFADEALADYFARKAHLSIRSSRCATDRLDRDIRKYSSTCYFEVIYVQGAKFLDGLRRDFGGAAFKRAIKAYSRDYRMGIGSNTKLLEAFRAEMGNKVVRRFRKRFPSLY